MAPELNLREEIISTCLEMNRLGINQGTSGNVSARWADGMLITPSGVPYEELRPPDIIYVEFGTRHHLGPHPPSSEWMFHRDILASRAEVGAVVHTHSTYATAMAIHGLDIPAHHYMVAAAGGSKIVCADYATFGTRELSKNAIAALDGRWACLLAHHGVIALGVNLSKALWLANEVENLSKQYCIAVTLGRPPILPEDEMRIIREKFKSYGPKK